MGDREKAREVIYKFAEAYQDYAKHPNDDFTPEPLIDVLADALRSVREEERRRLSTPSDKALEAGIRFLPGLAYATDCSRYIVKHIYEAVQAAIESGSEKAGDRDSPD